MHDPSGWSRLEDLFHHAAELPLAQRSAFLDAECAGDPKLRAEIESLLSHDAPPGQGFEDAIRQEAEAVAAGQWPIGRRIGAYRVTGIMGEGGMGAVYRAVRDDDQYQKEVAIKLVRQGLESEALLRRFRAERQILASLDHPSIARLLDGGATPEGLPYLVMELIYGVPITHYVNQHGLSPEARIRLFQKVCDAAQHAHQNSVVHRDIKPANILVTSDGTPKLLDFGIASVANQDTTVTRSSLWTPDYASPEQVLAQPVTPRTDVYSLGLILFELLTGQRAQTADNTSPSALERSICQTEVPLTRIAGDLDTIIQKATRKDPERRYATAGDLAQDLGRYLDRRPVRARKDSALYRLSKFLRRNQATSSTPTIILASAATNADEAGVTITGATGTGYFIPTFRIQGTFNDSNPSIQELLTMCVGLTSGCLLDSAATSTGGLQTVDTLFSPAIDSTTQFTFGTPFNFEISMALFFDRTSGQALPGPTVTGDFTNGLQLVSWKVVDANGNIIPGAQVDSQILALATAPEPSTFAMVALALAIAAKLRRLRHFQGA